MCQASAAFPILSESILQNVVFQLHMQTLVPSHHNQFSPPLPRLMRQEVTAVVSSGMFVDGYAHWTFIRYSLSSAQSLSLVRYL